MDADELQLRQSLDALNKRALAAQEQSDWAALRQTKLALVDPLAKVAQLRAHAYDFGAAGKCLQDLERLVNDLTQSADPKDKLGLDARLFYTIAIVDDVKGTYDLFESRDYVNGAATLERADKMYQQTADAFSQLGGSKDMVQAVQGQALRVRGLRLFGLGRYDIEAADTAKAEEELEQATEQLTRASSSLAKVGSLPASSGMNPAYSDSLAAYSRGFLFRARADAMAFGGNYKKSAKLLLDQINAFQQAKQPILGLTERVAESLTHRIAQEMELCEKRQKYFSSRSAAQTRSPMSLATILFAVLTLATLFFQLWAATYFGFGDRNIIFYVIALAFAIVVGGIGTGLATWGDGTAFFKQMFSQTQTKGK